jgi:hypothetical protein
MVCEKEGCEVVRSRGGDVWKRKRRERREKGEDIK